MGRNDVSDNHSQTRVVDHQAKARPTSIVGFAVTTRIALVACGGAKLWPVSLIIFLSCCCHRHHHHHCLRKRGARSALPARPVEDPPPWKNLSSHAEPADAPRGVGGWSQWLVVGGASGTYLGAGRATAVARVRRQRAPSAE